MKLLALVSLGAMTLVLGCDDKKEVAPAAPSASVTAAAVPTPAPTPSASAAPEVKKKEPIKCEGGSEVVFHIPGLEAEVRKKLAKPEGPIQFSELAKIKSINLTQVEVNQLDPCVFPKLTGVKDIFLGKGDLDDLSPLQTLTQLVSLRASINKVSDATPLGHLAQMDRLDLGRTQIADIGPLGNMVNLTELQLDDTPVESIAPLSTCTKLERLSIKNTRVKDLRPLLGLKKLKSLSVGGAPIDDTHVVDPLVAHGMRLEVQ